MSPPLRGLLVLLAADTLLSLAFINYFRRAFEVSPWLIAVHVPLALLLLAVAHLAPGVLLLNRRFRSWPAGRFLLAAPPAAVVSALVLLYLADLASNLWMGHHVTWKLAVLWMADWWGGGNLLSLSPWIFASALGLILAVFAAYAGLAGTIRRGLLALCEPPRTPWRWAAAALLAVTAGTAGATELARRTPRSELLSSDPILAFLRTTIAVHDDAELAFIETLTREDARCRAGYRPVRPFTPRNVIVIIADSLRADHTPLYGYHRPTTPFLSELAASGRLRQVGFATSTCAESNCGILSTLSSKTLRRQIPGAFKLYDLLKDQGYSTYFVLSGNHDWQGLREMYGREHTLYFDGRDAEGYSSSDDRVVFEGLARIPDAAGPAFFYVHLMSTHFVGVKHDRHRVYHPSQVSNNWSELFGGAFDRESVVNNYDNGVRQADAMIRDLFAAFERKGYLRDSLVVILADHGEALGDRVEDGYGHVTALYQELIRIPLLVYEDNPFDYGTLPFGTQIDVAPTIVDRLGLPVPPCWEGQSLIQSSGPPLTRHQTSLKTPCYALISRQDGRVYKYSSCFLGRREELYELTTDPDERVNLRDTADATLLAELREQVARIRSD